MHLHFVFLLSGLIWLDSNVLRVFGCFDTRIKSHLQDTLHTLSKCSETSYIPSPFHTCLCLRLGLVYIMKLLENCTLGDNESRKADHALKVVLKYLGCHGSLWHLEPTWSLGAHLELLAVRCSAAHHICFFCTRSLNITVLSSNLDEWIKFDDDKVSIVTPEDILRLSGGGDWHIAYVLLYGPRRVEIMEENEQ